MIGMDEMEIDKKMKDVVADVLEKEYRRVIVQELTNESKNRMEQISVDNNGELQFSRSLMEYNIQGVLEIIKVLIDKLAIEKANSWFERLKEK